MPEVTVGEVTDIARIEREWLDLERRSECSFFQSWGWIGCWLKHLPAQFRPKVLIVRLAGRTVGLGILTASNQRRHHALDSKSLFLNQTGHPVYDGLTIEYNGFLTEKGVSEFAAEQALRWLFEQDRTWEELYFSGLDPDLCMLYLRIANDKRLHAWVRDRKRADYVDLNKVRENGGDYLAVLGGNTRYQIRRSLRLYQKRGNLHFEVAQSPAQAFDFFMDLKELHQTYWEQRGEPGSFANSYFEEFHTALIRERFPFGEIQLAKASSAQTPIGYLYNLVKSGRVYAYQSGFNYEKDPKIKPGLACHYLAIDHNLNEGMEYYDFLAGENQQKKTMSTDHHDMTWLVFQRARPKFYIERALRWVKHLGPK